jgi:hypothetical protein
MRVYRVGERTTTDRQLASTWARLWGLHVRVSDEVAHEQWYWDGASWALVPAPVLWAPESATPGRRRLKKAWIARRLFGPPKPQAWAKHGQ